MEFPYDRENFKDRYTRQHRNKLCSTIVAHLSKDGLMFIHPTQNRSLTPREAARIQSFPDWFQFPVVQTHQFRLIGNAVPPLLGKSIGQGIQRWLAVAAQVGSRRSNHLPRDEHEAMEWLIPLVEAAENGTLLKVSADEFKRGWSAIGFIHNHLHPDSVQDNGILLVETSSSVSRVSGLLPQLAGPAYARSGWPANLVPIAEEAQRRYQRGELDLDEYYYSEAQIASHQWLKKRVESNAV